MQHGMLDDLIRRPCSFSEFLLEIWLCD